ncbi:MAG: AAA family ATPase [Enhygromyxa sp.]
MSPGPEEQLVPGELRKISLDDPRRLPTLVMPYGQEVAVIHASAGMRRIIALAYLLVWTWQEHVEACKLRGSTPANEIIFLIDELEAHLHPQWQRRIVPALLEVMDVLTGEHDSKVQLIVATHSPLVLASTESYFDPAFDAIWSLDLVDGVVQLEESPWRRRGDANNWLTSALFDLREPRSLEAERAMERARDLLRRKEVRRDQRYDRAKRARSELL